MHRHKHKQDFARHVRAFYTQEAGMQTETTPITTHQRRIQNDQRATDRYRRRPDIDRWHEERRLERELGRVVG